MSILDDAIREHLELKRAHGADDAELKKLEDEAFGPPARPGEDPLAEAPTEFLAAPGMDAEQAAAEAQGEGGRRAPNITDLQEAPQREPDAEPADEPSPSMEHQTIPVPHPEDPDDAPPQDSAPADEALAPAPEVETGPTTEERHAIAEQPTEFFDVEADLGAGSEQQSPSDEELVDSKLSEPRLAPVDPPSGIEASGPDAEVAAPFADEDEDDGFFSEQRLSDELNNALETPVEDEEEVFAPNVEPPPSEEESLPALPDPPVTDEHEAGTFTEERDALGTDEHETFPATDEHATFPTTDEHEAEPPSEESTAIYKVETHGGAEDDDAEEEAPKPSSPSSEHEDVLEDTPDFLEDAPEDDDLWFEQKPPKDFDFDD
jgi:hypothetical protein